MAKSHWLINSKKTEVKRFIKNDNTIFVVLKYFFVETWKIVSVLGEEASLMKTTVSLGIDLV